jgi:hypothetical protein
MRKELAILIFAAAVSCQAKADAFLSFPSEVEGGRKALELWLGQNNSNYSSGVESIKYKSSGEIVIVYHRSGSGLPLVDAYIYGCNSKNCSLIALMRAIQFEPRAKKPIVAELSSNSSELLLRTSDGVKHLRVALMQN